MGRCLGAWRWLARAWMACPFEVASAVLSSMMGVPAIAITLIWFGRYGPDEVTVVSLLMVVMLTGCWGLLVLWMASAWARVREQVRAARG